MKVAIVGAGIAGLANAYTYAKRGHRVEVYERSPKAAGASIRNFGMVWPIGQPAGKMAAMAGRSRDLWVEAMTAAGLPYDPVGSLHLAYEADEEAVAREFATAEPERAQWISAEEALRRSPAAVAQGLRGALWSEREVIVDPRLVIGKFPEFLASEYGVAFHWSTAVNDVRRLEADRVLVCSGHDFETLYPEAFAASGLVRCKLQMLRTVAQPGGWRMGPALAGGLTLRFYSSFAACPSLPKLKERYAAELPEYEKWGIHVMASQMPDGSITLGDSHEYGNDVDIFDKPEIDELVLAYLRRFAQFPEPAIAQRWHGVYGKGFTRPYFVQAVEDHVTIVSGLGGAGMTLSFGLAEEIYDPGSDI